MQRAAVLVGRLVTSAPSMHVGGLTFRIEAEHARIHAWPSLGYGNFVLPTERSPDSTELPVQLTVSAPPSMASFEVRYRASLCWDLLASATHRWIVSIAPSKPKPSWVARIDPEVTSIRIYCGEDIVREENGVPSIACPLHYPLDQVLVVRALARREGLLIHCAGVEIEGRGLLLAGRSGAGKSTISRLLAGHDRITVINDDRVLLRRLDGDGALHAFGTPWPGDAKIALNRRFPLDALLFIEQAEHNEVVPIASPTAALHRLFTVASILWYDRELLTPMLDFCEVVVRSVPAFVLKFTRDDGVVGALRKCARQLSPAVPESGT